MIREISTAEALAGIIEQRHGYLYNDFGGGNPKMCPIHAATCRWLPTMLKPPTGRLGVRKLWSDDLDELIAEIERRGKVWAFCGSESELAARRGAGPTAPPASIARGMPAAASAPLEPRSTPRAAAGQPEFRVRASAAEVRVCSAYRLQFDSKPRTKALKAAIGEAVRGLSAVPGTILEAVYASANTELVDAENVLLYNVDAGRFAAAARDGLRFERVHGAPADGCSHHHDYRIVPSGAPSRHWRAAPALVHAADLAIPRLDAFSKPDGVWRAVRKGAPVGARPLAGRYALAMTLAVPSGEAANPATIVKPLVDGLVAGLEAHDGRDLDVIAPRLATRLGIARSSVEAMLADRSRAWLGTRRLLWARADGLQWNPGDDECVSATLLVTRGSHDGWRLGFALAAVEPLDR